jgi:hypothetical protein
VIVLLFLSFRKMKKKEVSELIEIEGGNCFLIGGALVLSYGGGPLGVFVGGTLLGPWIIKCWNT